MCQRIMIIPRQTRGNPDPDQWVGYGDRTVDEMAHAWMNVVYLSDEEYATMIAQRKGAVGVFTQQQ